MTHTPNNTPAEPNIPPESAPLDAAYYLDEASRAMDEPGKNVSVALPNQLLNIVHALSMIDSEPGRNVTLGAEIRAAILFYGDHRRRHPDFNGQIEAARQKLQSTIGKLVLGAPEEPQDTET